MKAFKGNIEKLTLDNDHFRKVLYTAQYLQLVLISLEVGEDIGEESHLNNDQFFRLESGVGHLFNSIAFAKMKLRVMLNNTSPGAVIKPSHAVGVLKKQQLGYLGIDAQEGEENLFFKDVSQSIIQDNLIERLTSFNNVIIRPQQIFLLKKQ